MLLSLPVLLALCFASPDLRERNALDQTPPTTYERGLPTDPSFFPIAVWLQDPRNAAKYKAAGINVYVALWRGPTEEQLALLKAADVKLICRQNAVGRAHRDDPTIVGWMHGDEPDNAQTVTDRSTGKKSYGPPIAPAKIIADYERLKANDPTRPIMLNLGQGVANDAWKGRGPSAKLDDYKEYVKGSDIVSYDVYPAASPEIGVDKLWLVAKGLDRLRDWTGGKKTIWNCIECTHISDAHAKATPDQVKAEVWMSLIHGSRGLVYFVHQFQPRFDEHALLDDPEMLRTVTAINKQVRELAPALNSPSLHGLVVASTNSGAPIDAVLKKHGGKSYVFAAAMRNHPARGSFSVAGLPAETSAEVLGEGRSVKVVDGKFDDDFDAYGVHLYVVRSP
jgi:hypothetical protein